MNIIFSLLINLILRMFVGLVLIPIYCAFMTPYFLYKARSEKGGYLDNLFNLYEEFSRKSFFYAINIKPDDK